MNLVRLTDFLPMLNFVTDPIIYGIRMREVRIAYKKLFSCILGRKSRKPSHQTTGMISVRFSAIDNTIVP